MAPAPHDRGCRTMFSRNRQKPVVSTRNTSSRNRPSRNDAILSTRIIDMKTFNMKHQQRQQIFTTCNTLCTLPGRVRLPQHFRPGPARGNGHKASTSPRPCPPPSPRGCPTHHPLPHYRFHPPIMGTPPEGRRRGHRRG